MKQLDRDSVENALRAVGESLQRAGLGGTIDLVVAGGSAVLLGGLLQRGRLTVDCDVVWSGDEATWERISSAAIEVGSTLGLPPRWLSRECSIFIWCLPLGWHERAEPVGMFGPLRVRRLHRRDLMGMKIVSAPRRPQDYLDIESMQPTAADLDWIIDHLDRLASEHLGGEDFRQQRDLVEALRSKP